MTYFVTGGDGFLGWHLRCRLAAQGQDAVALGRGGLGSLGDRLRSADSDPVVLHLAGVNRAPTEGEVEGGNVELAQIVASSVTDAGRPVHVVYANSIQARQDNPYGRGKARAASLLEAAAAAGGGSVSDVLLPNLFGEHGRPHYNSFVATFCHEVAHERAPEVQQDRDVPLLHVQRAAQLLIDAADDRVSGHVEPEGETRSVSEVLDQIRDMHRLYAVGELPDLSTPWGTDLFNTYRSFTFPQSFPIRADVHEDPRGRLFETVRMNGGVGQAYMSTTRPGQVRGEHYHLHKFERFFVVSGEAEIQLRRLFTDEVVTFRISGDDPGFVDMPTMWVHNIRNIGSTDLITMFWSDQLLDPANPDQFPQRVEETTA